MHVSARRCFTPFLAMALTSGLAHAQVNGVGQKPYLGWSSFSQQTIDSSFLTQATISAQSDAMVSSGLGAHGFNFINIDSGWMGSFDANGRPIPSTTTFPDITALVAHIHANGQKAGIYWIPGVEQPAVQANYPILGTPYHIQDILQVPYTAGNAFGSSGTSPYHYKIDFSKPGAQAYINSVVALFASWGIDFIKLDAVTPGSYSDNLTIDNRNDVAAWSQAIAASGRPIWLTISWDLDQDYLSTWQQYANARRIDPDIECEGNCSTITDWQRIYERFRDIPAWEHAAGPSVGWNDPDSLEIGDGALDGLTEDEKQSSVTLWALAAAPMYLGGDLTKIDSVGTMLATNDEVLAVGQAGKPAVQALGGRTPVWIGNAGNGIYYVGIFNLDDVAVNVSVPWNEVGLAGVSAVRDLWNHANLGAAPTGFSTSLPGHGSRLLKVSATGYAPLSSGTSYEAESATLGGGASTSNCTACSGGAKVSNLGLSTSNTATFTTINAPAAGTYLMQVDSLTQGLRSYIYTVNGGLPQTLDSGGSSFNLPSSTTVPVALHAGNNSVQFGNPTSYAPDLDRVVIRGNGTAAVSAATTYEAENATLSGSASSGFCNYCSGLSQVNNIGGGTSGVTFSNVMVASTGNYQLEIDYATGSARSFNVSVNGGAATELDLSGSSFAEPQSTVLTVPLNAGVNTIAIGSSSYGPNLDRIVVAPIVASPSLSGSITHAISVRELSALVVGVRNTGSAAAQRSRIARVAFTQTAGSLRCAPKVGSAIPMLLGNIAPGRTASLVLPVSFVGCGADAQFTASMTYIANHGAEVGTVAVPNIAVESHR